MRRVSENNLLEVLSPNYWLLHLIWPCTVVQRLEGGLDDCLHLEVVGKCEDDGEEESRESEEDGGVEPAVTELVERVDHGEVSLQAEGDGHVDAGGEAGLGDGEGEGDEVVPDRGGVGRAELGQGEGEEGGDEEESVHQGQEDHQPDDNIIQTDITQLLIDFTLPFSLFLVPN